MEIMLPLMLFLKASTKTTYQQPFLELPKEDSWYILNCILNQLSSFPQLGHFTMAVKPFVTSSSSNVKPLPTASTNTYPYSYHWFVFGITYSLVARNKKLRVVIMSEEELKTLSESWKPEVEDPSHHKRIDTLKIMNQLYLKEKKRLEKLDENEKILEAHQKNNYNDWKS